MKILIVDNHDSFTFNLLHYLEQFTEEAVSVIRNTDIDLNTLNSYDKIVLSPGPGLPSETKNLREIIEVCVPQIPLLGVCLGHQAIYEMFGGRLQNLGKVIHGESTEIQILNESDPLFAGISNPMTVAHYHSWVVDSQNIPPEIEVLAMDNSKHIMSFKHRLHPIYAVQFHPESILTPQGLQLIENWVGL